MFGLKYFAELRSKFKGVFWRVEIAERGYQGASEEMRFVGESPLGITWEKKGDEFFVPIKGSEANINIMCFENFHYIGLFTSDPRKFRVSIYRNTKLYWRGYVVADLYSENFTAPPYQVSIKAVDGFALLNGIPFQQPDGTKFKGRKSLWELLSGCIDLLELDLEVSDWMDLYAEGMNENSSPMGQVYMDMERLYATKPELTYREVLQLCLLPFTAQIFQSNGAVHIRRAISLYNDTRPFSFYAIGSDFPSGWLTTADGQSITTAKGDAIVTQATRESVDSMWNDDINVLDTSIMNITPALRNIVVECDSNISKNIGNQIGFYDMEKWNKVSDLLTLRAENTLRLRGSSVEENLDGAIINHKGYPVQRCLYDFKFEVILSAFDSGSEAGLPEIVFGFKVVGAEKTYWYDGYYWSPEEKFYSKEASSTFSKSKGTISITLSTFPCDGLLVFCIKQTLHKRDVPAGHRGGYFQWCDFIDMKLTPQVKDEYKDYQRVEMLVNPANNADMTISMTIADAPPIPNSTLIYTMFLLDKDGSATKLWRSKGKNDFNTLLVHAQNCALRYRQVQSKRIDATMLTGKHIDLNTVVQDEKYLKSGFYINSLELDSLTDDCRAELVEMPQLINNETPEPGDDTVCVLNADTAIVDSTYCDGNIILQYANRDIYSFNAENKRASLLFNTEKDAAIYPGDSAFVVMRDDKITAYTAKGKMLKESIRAGQDVATYMDGCICIRYQVRDGGIYAFTRMDYKGDLPLIGGTWGQVISLSKQRYGVVLNTSKCPYVHDQRVTKGTMIELSEGYEVMSLSDSFLCINELVDFKIYRRNGLSLEDLTLLKTIPGKADFVDHTPGQVAYSIGGKVCVWHYDNNTIVAVKNIHGALKPIRGLFYIGGILHIVRDKAIYKYMDPR